MYREEENVDYDTSLAVKILDDPTLCSWFFHVCIGRTPGVEVSEEIAKEMERQRFVLKTDLGLQLGPAGKKFVRKLGLVSEKDQLDLNPVLLDYMSGRTPKEPKKDKKEPSEGNKENK